MGGKGINGQAILTPSRNSPTPTSSKSNITPHPSSYTLIISSDFPIQEEPKMPEYAKNQPVGFKNAIERVAIVGVGASLHQNHINNN
jgi:hypothetical protein